MFLTMMGEHLYDFDTEQELLGAFECFDENDSGFVKADEMRKWLSESGERMDQSEVPMRVLLSIPEGLRFRLADRQTPERAVYRSARQLQLSRVGKGPTNKRGQRGTRPFLDPH